MYDTDYLNKSLGLHLALTICIVEHHVVVQLGSAGRGQLEDFQGAGCRYDGVGGRHGRNDMLYDTLGQSIGHPENSFEKNWSE